MAGWNRLDLWNVIVVAYLAVWYVNYRINKLWKLMIEIQQNIGNVGEQIKQLRGH